MYAEKKKFFFILGEIKDSQNKKKNPRRNSSKLEEL